MCPQVSLGPGECPEGGSGRGSLVLWTPGGQQLYGGGGQDPPQWQEEAGVGAAGRLAADVVMACFV